MDFAISSESMRLSDEYTIKNCGVSAIQLMDRAANAIFNEIESGEYRKIAIVCGSGNNGGDGYCLALKLLDKGYNVAVFGKTPKTDSARYYFDILINKYPFDFKEISKLTNITNLSRYHIVVDCLLGNGIKGNLTDEYIGYINVINTGKYIISCDIPSGLNSDTGVKSPVSVKANKTIAIQCYKPGHFLQDGKDHTGELKVCDIGIEVLGEKYYICDNEFVKKIFLPRLHNSHKGDYGRCGIVACSKHYVGAGILSYDSSYSVASSCEKMGTSSLSVGCGYSYLFVPETMLPYMWSRVTHSCLYSHKDLKNHKLDSIAFGMGIEDNNEVFDIVCDLPCKKVIDADGLNILSKNFDKIDKLKNCVLTPHLMEFSRLTGLSLQEIIDNPIEIAEYFANKYQVVLLLKGPTTIITDGDKIYLSTSGNSALAKGGSGDVLSGVIAGLLAQKIPPLESAVVAAYICGKTAEFESEAFCKQSVLPNMIANDVGFILSKILKDQF